MRGSEIQEAAQALDAGDALRALSLIEGRNDGHPLAIRGVALAQLEELGAARQHLRRAMIELGRMGAPLHRARAAAALAEIAAGERELSVAVTALAEAADELESLGDHANTAWMFLTLARLLVLLGDRDAADRAFVRAESNAAQSRSQVVRAMLELARAEARQRSFRAREAEAALSRAAEIAVDHPILAREIARQKASLSAPAARLLEQDRETILDAFALEALYRADDAFIVDALRWTVMIDGDVIELSRRPVLFELLRVLARASPGPASGDALIAAAFAAQVINESHRARLRVELGRLRRVVGPIVASRGGWSWSPSPARKVLTREALANSSTSGYPACGATRPGADHDAGAAGRCRSDRARRKYRQRGARALQAG